MAENERCENCPNPDPDGCPPGAIRMAPGQCGATVYAQAVAHMKNIPDGHTPWPEANCRCGHEAVSHPRPAAVVAFVPGACMVRGCGCRQYRAAVLPTMSPIKYERVGTLSACRETRNGYHVAEVGDTVCLLCFNTLGEGGIRVGLPAPASASTSPVMSNLPIAEEPWSL